VHNVQISRTQLDQIRDSLEDWAAGFIQVDIRHDYVGRTMYGGTCIAVAGSDTAIPAAFLFLVAEILGLDFLQFLGEVGGGEGDSLGMLPVTYWRSLTLLDPA